MGKFKDAPTTVASLPLMVMGETSRELSNASNKRNSSSNTKQEKPEGVEDLEYSKVSF